MSNPAPSRPVNLTLFPSLAFLLFGVALALGFVTATDKFSRSLTQMRQNRPEIVVKGVAAQDIRSAQGMVACALTWRGEDFAAAGDNGGGGRAGFDDVAGAGIGEAMGEVMPRLLGAREIPRRPLPRRGVPRRPKSHAVRRSDRRRYLSPAEGRLRPEGCVPPSQK